MVRTMKRIAPVSVTILALSTAAALGAEADPGQGARVFRACAACHSLEANRNMTGPSLAGVWNRKAGGLASFTRYSDAMKLSGITWDEQSTRRPSPRKCHCFFEIWGRSAKGKSDRAIARWNGSDAGHATSPKTKDG
jgi:Cytochrome c2